MADLERLFTEFVEAHLAGRDPDPWEYIDRLEGADREELEELIDAYYVDAPPRPWDPEAFRGSAAERLTEELDRSFRGGAGLWPAILPRLRNRARLRRSELVQGLAEALGVGDRAERVGDYYHQMEQGLLRSEGVSDRVLGALGELVGASAEALRRAGRPLAEGPPGPETDEVFARTGRPEPEQGAIGAGEAGEPRAPDRSQWDEVDELFRGG